jgi:Ca-activated chloride channel family protein
MRGGTALFDAVLKSLKNMADEKQRNPGYQYSVVAFTDGENNKGRTFEEFRARLRAVAR